MDTLTLSISPYEENQAMDGFVFTVTAIVNGRSLPSCLDVDEFFSSFHKSGNLPIFNCSCGVFECGGYSVDVRSEKQCYAWTIRHPIRRKGEVPLDKSSYQFTWENIRDAAGELLATLYTVTAQNPGEEVRSGTVSEELAGRLSYYQQQYDSLL